MTQYKSKRVLLEQRADKEIAKLPKSVREAFDGLFALLHESGFLSFPQARKLSGYDLFEIRIKRGNIYRCLYCYHKNHIVILSAFEKKSQKTPTKEIEKALQRKNNLEI
jgi:phage-related protein